MPLLDRRRGPPTEPAPPRAPRRPLSEQKGKLAILICSLLVSALLSFQLYVASQLHKHGQIVLGKVTRKFGRCEPMTMSGGDPLCLVWYEFECEGRKYAGWSELDNDFAPNVSPGFLFPIRYLPGKPSRNELAGDGHTHAELYLWLVVAVAGSGISFYTLLRRPRIKPHAPLLHYRPLEADEVAKASSESRQVWWAVSGTFIALVLAALLDFQGTWGFGLMFLALLSAVWSVALWRKRQKLLQDLEAGQAEVCEGRVTRSGYMKARIPKRARLT